MHKLLSKTLQLAQASRLLGLSGRNSQLNSLSLVCASQARFTEEKKKFDKLQTNENLLSRLSDSQSVYDILKVCQTNEALLQNEHIVLSLRLLARYLKGLDTQQINKLEEDAAYQLITKKAAGIIENLNEYESLDFLFWMRKFRQQRISLNIGTEKIQKFHQRVDDLIKQKAYNFRNLVNLYYDYSFLNRNCDPICQEILKELKTESKLLTPFTIIQILQAASRNPRAVQARELALVQLVSQNFSDTLEEFDTDQKCAIFKYLSLLQLNFGPPRFKLPQVLYKLRQQLKEKLDQMSEPSVINILLAYQYLPREFPSDILEEIKEMVIITIQNNPTNIKSFFLLDFIEVIRSLRKKKFDEKRWNILSKEIASRIPNDEYLCRFKNFERVLDLYQKGLRSEELKQAIIAQAAKLDPKGIYPAINEFFITNKIPLNTLLEKSLELQNPSEFVAKQKVYVNVRLYIQLCCPEVKKDTYGPLIEALKVKIQGIAKEHPGLILSNLDSSNLNTKEKNELVVECIKQLQQNFQTAALQNQNILKLMLISSVTKEHRDLWTQWISSNGAQLTPVIISRLMDGFMSQEDYKLNDFILFFQLLQLDNYKKVSLKRLLFLLKGNNQFFIDIVRYDNIFRKFLQVLIKMCEAQQKDIKLFNIYIIALRLESLGQRAYIFQYFLNRCYQLFKESGQPSNRMMDILFGQMLIGYGQLDIKYAKQIYESVKELMNDPNQKASFIGYIAQKSQAEFAAPEKKGELASFAEILKKRIAEGQSNKVITSIASIFKLPPEFLKADTEFYLKHFKDALPSSNERHYINSLFSLQPLYVRAQFDLYYPFLKELMNTYNLYNRRMPISDIIRILFHFAILNCRHPTIYNSILIDIGNYFNVIGADDRIKCMNAFSYIKIKQNDFYQKNLEKIAEFPSNFRGYLDHILNSLFKIGYDQPESVKDILKLIQTILSEKDFKELVATVKYLPLLKLPNEAEMVDKYFTLITPDQIQKQQQSFKKKQELHILAEYYKKLYPAKDYHTKLQGLISEETRAAAKASYLNPATAPKQQETVELICQYLTAMKVPFDKTKKFDDISIEIFLTEQNAIVKTVQPKDINFDRTSYSGVIGILKRLYESYKNQGVNKIIFINMSEFLGLGDHMSKINLLISEGIENRNVEGNYDFSKIQLKQKPVEEEQQLAPEDQDADEQTQILPPVVEKIVETIEIEDDLSQPIDNNLKADQNSTDALPSSRLNLGQIPKSQSQKKGYRKLSPTDGAASNAGQKSELGQQQQQPRQKSGSRYRNKSHQQNQPDQKKNQKQQKPFLMKKPSSNTNKMQQPDATTQMNQEQASQKPSQGSLQDSLLEPTDEIADKSQESVFTRPKPVATESKEETPVKEVKEPTKIKEETKPAEDKKQ